MLYILMFDRSLGNPCNPRGQARFYLGYCEDGRLHTRMKEHRAGIGAAMTRYCNRVGIGYRPVLVLPGTPLDERRLKRWKNTPAIVRRYRPDLVGEHKYSPILT